MAKRAKLTAERRQQAVRLYWSGLTAAEIAEIVDCAMQNVYVLWWKAKKEGKLPHKTRPVGGF